MPAANTLTEKSTKMIGYLEKRGRLTITGRWKKWWCMLKGQLLLFYKSRTQYLRLSPCCGSLNIALVKSIQPQKGCQLYVITHSQLIILRTQSKEKQQNWFHAFINVSSQNIYQLPTECNSPLAATQKTEDSRKDSLKKITREPSWKRRLRFHLRNVDQACTSQLQEHITSNTVDHDSRVILNYCSSRDENVRIDSETKRFKEITSDRAEKRIRRFSSFHCVMKTPHENSQIVNVNNRSYSYECIFPCTHSNIPNSDANPSRNESKYGSHCNATSTTDKQFSQRDSKCMGKIKKRSDSKRSLDFFKRILPYNNLKNRIQITEAEDENKNSIDTLSIQETTDHNIYNETSRESPVINYLNEGVSSNTEEKEITTEYKYISKDTPPINHLPLHIKNSQLWTKEPNNHQEYLSPILPAKEKINTINYSSKISFMNSNSYGSMPLSRNENLKNHENIKADSELDSLLSQLNLMNVESETKNDEKEDPDYDFPIPYASLVDKAVSECESGQNKEYSKTMLEGHSTDFRYRTLVSTDITPDSLDMPWLLSASKDINNWTTARDYRSLLNENDSDAESNIFLDSLNIGGVYS